MPAAFAFLHHLAAFALVAALAVEFVLIRAELTVKNARTLLLVDAVFGAAAGAILVIGFLRVFYFEKGGPYYFHSVPFIVKLSLFAVIGLLSIYPTRRFLSWRSSLKQGVVPAVEASERRAIRTVIHLELAALVLLILCAALMARGIGYVGRDDPLQPLERAHMTRPQPQGFLAVPPTGKGPGVLVLHAWWGLNDTMKAFCTRLAEAGFIAFAPDLYHGKVADTIPDAEILGKALDANQVQAKADIADATLFLSERVGHPDRGLAVIGFSLGAYYALELAAADPEHIRSVVIFYGTGAGDYGNSRAAYLGHFAEHDEFEPKSNVDALEVSLRRAGRPVTFYRYRDTGHWFVEPDRVQAYNPAAANQAWDRTLAFLKRSPSQAAE